MLNTHCCLVLCRLDSGGTYLAGNMVTAQATRSQRFFLWLAPATVTAALGGVAIEALVGNYVPVPLWIVGAVMVPLAWWSFLSIPRCVSLDSGILAFHAPRGTFEVAIADIDKIVARKWSCGYVIFFARRQQVFVLRAMPNLGAVAALVSEQHPATLVIGQLPAAA